ncbi:MAG: hypothetical protein QXV82_10505 [Ignisphaera sp.]
MKRVVSAQDNNPKSPTYGIWPYFLEESLSQMKIPDWNWADFIGSTLLLIEIRHGEKLSPSLREEVRRAIENAARTIEREGMSLCIILTLQLWEHLWFLLQQSFLD